MQKTPKPTEIKSSSSSKSSTGLLSKATTTKSGGTASKVTLNDQPTSSQAASTITKLTSAPSSGTSAMPTPAPSSKSTPAPSSKSNPAPSSKSNPAPSSKSNPAPSSKSTPAPSSGTFTMSAKPNPTPFNDIKVGLGETKSSTSVKVEAPARPTTLNKSPPIKVSPNNQPATSSPTASAKSPSSGRALRTTPISTAKQEALYVSQSSSDGSCTPTDIWSSPKRRGEEDEEFNKGFILPPLIVQLRKILDQYPSDAHILKELIQNAEDAGATEVKFLYDCNTYGQDKRFLHHPDLARFQGPALYAFNDAVFDEEDWRGIRMIAQSVKQDDPFKVGHFGMGFKSVFHITDLPSVLSGNMLAYIDPQQTCFPSTCYGWNFEKKNDCLIRLRQQFEPFHGLFGCTDMGLRRGHYKGTIFRMPLRQAGSSLSSNVIREDKINELFDTFRQEAPLILLFLKNLESIELHRRAQGDKTPRLVYRIAIDDRCLADVRQCRRELTKKIQACKSSQTSTESTCRITLRSTSYLPGEGEKTNTYEWLVTNYLYNQHVSAIMKSVQQEKDSVYLPLVGTAMPLSGIADDKPYELTDDDGKVFCFLPMIHESATGLPVHVNGFFSLEQNRKYVKWPSSIRNREDLLDRNILWNQCLLREALPKAYAAMLLRAIDLHRTREAEVDVRHIYRSFPSFDKVNKKWDSLMVPLFLELFKHPVVYTQANRGQWIDPRDAIFDTLEEAEPIHKAVIETLSGTDMRLAAIPPHVVDAIKKCCRVNLTRITPNIIANAVKEVQGVASLQWETKLSLLRYFLSHCKYDLLDELNILPLANGGFETFYSVPSKADRPIYLAVSNDVIDLLPALRDDFVDPEIDQDIKSMLTRAVARGYTQIRVTDPETVAQLLPMCMPRFWRQTECVVWNPAEFGHPPEGWLEKLWIYLCRNSPRDLSIVEGLPVLPSRTVKTGQELICLSAKKPLISRFLDGMSLPTNIQDVLGKLGILVVHELPIYVKSHQQVTRDYVMSPSYIGVLRCFSRVAQLSGRGELVERVHGLEVTEKRAIREFIAKISSYEIEEDLKIILRCLPLFETVPLSGGYTESVFVSCSDVTIAAPSKIIPIHTSTTLLDMTPPEAQRLAAMLGVRQLDIVSLYKEVIFPDIKNALYTTDEIQGLMLHVLKHYSTLCETDGSFKATLRTLPFLSRKGNQVTIDRLYDPDDEILRQMFLGEDTFPSGPYAEPAVVSVLREVGLRSSGDVDPDDIIEAAYFIEESQQQKSLNADKLGAKSNGLFDYLRRHSDKLKELFQGRPLFEWLSQTKWVLCLQKRPDTYPSKLRWHSREPECELPSEITVPAYAPIIGSVMAVAALSAAGTMAEVFGWSQPPALPLIVSHFSNVLRAYEKSERGKFLVVVCQIYEAFSQHKVEDVLRELEAKDLRDWIWNGEGFTSPDRIVIDEPLMDFRPFIYFLPAELTQWSEFFLQCGVNTECNLPRILSLIKHKYDSSQTTSSSEVNRDLHLCISVLNELKNRSSASELKDLHEKLLVPVSDSSPNTLELKPLRFTTYCDEEWLRQGYDVADVLDGDSNLHLVHPNLPSSTAEAIGVPSLMSRMLDADDIDLSFGQCDSLTRRLHSLLQDYTDGLSIPKELLQNADDAGATELKILYDERTNDDCRSCLIDEGMRECHGPAIWVYNDATFTDDDIANITRLGGATKLQESHKIGKFGLGFNSVYNMTDVPSFISRHAIVIFDPHTTHLGRSIKNKTRPGIKLDTSKHKRKLQRLVNQFKPFNGVFGCNLSAQAKDMFYNGTLFRFPLRTKHQASTSEISSKHYNDTEVKALLNLLVKNAESLLLFTQNVRSISVHYLKDGCQPSAAVDVFTATKKLLTVLEEPQVLIPATRKSDLDILQCASSFLTKMKSGDQSNKNFEAPSLSVIVDIRETATADAAGLLGFSRLARNKQWLVCYAVGTELSLRMALREGSLSPVGGVALPLEGKSEVQQYVARPLDTFGADHNAGQLFVFMPMSVHTGLPVHITGMFAVTSSRREVCERLEDDKFDIRPVWNENLLADAVFQAYCKLLTCITRICRADSIPFYALWPMMDNISKPYDVLAIKLYNYLASNACDIPAFSNGREWMNISELSFLSSRFNDPKIISSIERIVHQTCSSTGSTTLYMPPEVRKGFVAAKTDANIERRTYSLARFLSDIVFPNISVIHQSDRNAAVLFALQKSTDNDVLDVLRSSECIPAGPNGDVLKRPCELVDPTASSVAALYDISDMRFPYGEFSNRTVLAVLVSLGMITTDISVDELIERAELVKDLSAYRARQRALGLLRHISAHCKPDDKIVELFQSVQFLPVMDKPQDFPCQWFSETELITLVKGSDAFLPVHKYLVGSVACLLDDDIARAISEDVLNAAGLSRKPPLELVLQQITVLSTAIPKILQHGKGKFVEVQHVLLEIYQYLDAESQNVASSESINKALSDMRCILIGDQLVSPSQLAMSCDENCMPFLVAVPDSIKSTFPNLLQALGVKEKFAAVDFVNVLKEVYEQHSNMPLSKDALKLVLKLVTLTSEAMTDVMMSISKVVTDIGQVYIPDASGCMRPSTELCFSDPDSSFVPEIKSYAATSQTSHPAIPFNVCKILGVNTKRQDMVQKFSRGIPFGQRENLVNRLRRILESYPCDKEILKELLQNADDAGATEIHFIKDARQHGTARVFDDAWRNLQGPALLVYNNRAFSQADLEGIQKLGEGSKGTDPNKTGQYGVGFNCVYHLTDAPSFLSCSKKTGDVLCVFDPLAKFVPGSSTEFPGRMFDDVKELRRIFKDVFTGYLEDIYNSPDRTMFRLPLRNQVMASESQISNQEVTVDDVDRLLEKFRDEVLDCQLFLNNISSITITEVDKITNRLANPYKIDMKMSEAERAVRAEFSEYVRNVGTKLRSHQIELSDVAAKSVGYTVRVTDSKGFSARWLIVQRIGFDRGVSIPASVQEAFAKRELLLMPRGGVAALLETSNPEKRSKPMRIFCFLPMPIKSGFPVHVNGHFALDHENRRGLWNYEDGGAKRDWNNLLLSKVIAPAYVHLLRHAASMISDNDTETYSQLFPSVDSGYDEYWNILFRSIYQSIEQSQEQLLPVARVVPPDPRTPDRHRRLQVGLEWMSTRGMNLSKPYFNNLNDTFKDDLKLELSPSKRVVTRKRSRAELVYEALISCGVKLVTLPLKILDSFRKANVNITLISPQEVVEFLKTHDKRLTSCNIGNIPAPIEVTVFKDVDKLKAVLEYCLQDQEAFLKNLVGLPLLLTEDGQLRAFSAARPVFVSPHHKTLPSCESYFMHHAVLDSLNASLVKIERSPVCQIFDIEALSRLLDNVLKADTYKTKQLVSWQPEASDCPNSEWLRLVWKFIIGWLENLLLQSGEASEQDLTSVQLGTPERDVTLNALKPLDNWCVLPACIYKQKAVQTISSRYHDSFNTNVTHCLIPLSLAHVCVDTSQAGLVGHQLRDCLRKIGVPELNQSIVDSGIQRSGLSAYEITRSLVSNMDDPSSVLGALSFAASERSLADLLSAEDCYYILKYFGDHFEMWADSKKNIDILRGLPVFHAIHGDLVAVKDADLYVLPPDIPKDDMDKWQKRENIVFLKQNKALRNLHEAIGCQFLEEAEVYKRFVFRHFEYLTPQSRIAHLQFIKDGMLDRLSEPEKESFLKSLRKLPCFTLSDGSLVTADALYDPYHSVFKVMLAGRQDVFPPSPFNEFKWLDFMHLMGLQHVVSDEQLIEFAQEIASSAETDNKLDEVFNKSRAIVSYLFKRQNLVNDETLLNKMAAIPFIPAAKISNTLEKVHPSLLSKSERHPYIAFSDGMPESDDVLVWTTNYLLPDWANPHKLTESDVSFKYPAESELSTFKTYISTLAAKLHVLAEPGLDVVIQNVKNICGDNWVVEGSEDFRGFLKVDVMKKVYKYLQQKSLDSDTVKTQLKEVRCIITDVGYTFVKPKQVAVNIYEESQIKPFLFKCPEDLGEFKNLFLMLGATTEPTVDQYAFVLECLYEQTGGEKLHPNELLQAFKALRGLFDSLRRNPEQLIETEMLYLPSTSGCLYPSMEVVFNNELAYIERVINLARPFLVDLAECKIIESNHENVLKRLPLRLQPAMLTDIVHEDLEEYSRSSVVSSVTSSVAEKLRHHLNSKAFAQGISRLLRHEQYRSGTKLSAELFDHIQNDLKRLRVYGLRKVRTYLKYNGDRLKNSEMDGQCFVESELDQEDGSTIWTIYVDHTLTLNDEFMVGMAESVNKVVAGLLRNCIHYLQPILSCAPHSISRILDRLKVRPDRAVEMRQTTLPTPGSFVPIEDHHLLMEEFEQFDLGEYVGFELDDDDNGGQTFIYAVIVEQVEDTTEEEVNNGGGTFTQKYMINIGDDNRLVVAANTDLYKFHRVEGFVSRNASTASQYRNASFASSYHTPSNNSMRDSNADHSAPKTPRTPFMDNSVFEDAQSSQAYGSENEVDGNGETPKGIRGRRGRRLLRQQGGKPEETPAEQTAETPSGPRTAPKTPLNKASAGRGTKSSTQARAAPGVAAIEGTMDGDEVPFGERAEPEGKDSGDDDSGQNGTDGKDPKEETEEEGLMRVLNEVSDALEAAWKLEEKQRRKVIKRLLLKWHPDKNLNNEKMATVVVQHIQHEVERLELGLPRPQKYEEFVNQYNFDPRNPFASNENFKKNFYNAYQFFFEQMNQRAKEHREQRERYKENFSREYNATNSEFNFDVPPSFSSTNPQPVQARRFLKQAQEDLRAADNDYECREPAFEWVCFKAHQAAEKALKAAQFSVDAVTSFSHDLTSLAATIEDLELRRLAMKLQAIVGDSNKLYNPNPIDFVIIPHDMYTKEVACDAIHCAQDILERVKEFVEVHE